MTETNLSDLLWNLFESTPKPWATSCMWKDFYSLYPAMAQHVWQSWRAQPPKSSAVLFHCQAIITAIRLERLVNLNLGIILWHQGKEDVLCCVVCLYIGPGIRHLPQRGAGAALNYTEWELWFMQFTECRIDPAWNSYLLCTVWNGGKVFLLVSTAIVWFKCSIAHLSYIQCFVH